MVYFRRILGILFFLIVGQALLQSTALAQQLSPAQQQMLNSLPPAQRQQALDALADLRTQGVGGGTTRSINEVDDSTFVDLLDRQRASTEFEEARAKPRSRLVLRFLTTQSLSSIERKQLDEDPILRRIAGSHLFVLDEAGVLFLPGLEGMPLLGLNEKEIQSRLETEAYLSAFQIEAQILGQEPIGVEALEPFGYSILVPDDVSFTPPGSGPVPANYVLGPGDTVRVQLFGNLNSISEHEITRDGTLSVPEIGPVSVAGMSFADFRADLNKRVQEMLIGTQISVTMGPLRSIRVFVLGDVNQPGSYVIGGLSTISSALYRSGGVSDVGTLRNVQLKRKGVVVARLDLYDLFVRGDNSGDLRVQPGDVIFVPPVAGTIAIAGAIKRPAIYEMRGTTSVADAVELAGGLTSEAFGEGVRLERIESGGERTVLSVDLADREGMGMSLRSGDTLVVPEVLPDFDRSVTLSGHVYRPGNYPWRSGMRLTDLISSVGELKDDVDLNYILIRRERARGAQIEAVSADLEAALLAPHSASNIELVSRDQVFVFSQELGRKRIVEPIVEELRRRATHDEPARQVQIGGNVRSPGLYPLEMSMRISDLLRAGGGLTEAAYVSEAELTRYTVNGTSGRVVNVMSIDLAGVLRGDESADIALEAYDYLSINTVPEWKNTWTVSLEGEVRFPGEYRVRPGETLAEVLSRAGGVTANAFTEGSVFLRESLREQEQEQIELLTRRMESDLATLSLQQATAGTSDVMSTGQSVLDQLRDTEAVGRLVINSELLVDGETSDSLELRDGDTLLVPTRSQVVTVLGETQQNTSHLYLAGQSRDDYINLSGGLTRRADKKRIYIVRASGAVVVNNRSRWFGRRGRIDIQPGDTIVVPLDADKMRPITYWTSATQILYQAAIAVAAVNSF